MDGIVAGDGEGPLAPNDVPLGVVLAATDPVALDLVAVRLMGFDARRIPKVWEAIVDTGPRITSVRDSTDVVVGEVLAATFDVRERSLDEIRSNQVFVPHPGWRGHIEDAECPRDASRYPAGERG